MNTKDWITKGICQHCEYKTEDLCSHGLCSECCEELRLSDEPFDNIEYKEIKE